MHRATLLALFFFSGMAALIYQVTWVRQATLVFGVSVYAVSMVLAAFMGGSALGSFGLRRLADRTANPLRLYSLLQLGIALFGLLTPWLLVVLMPLYGRIAQTLPADTALLTPIRLLFSLLILVPPTFLMGATLPVMARAYAGRAGRISGDVGQLYAVETLGAALGCGLAGLILLRTLGTRETVWVAVVLNLVAAGVAWWTARGVGSGEWGMGEPQSGRQLHNARPARTAARSTQHSPLPTPHSLLPIPFAYAVSGFVALGYEVVWTRILTVFTLHAVFSFSIMLTTFLLGLTLGGWIGVRWVRRRRPSLVDFAYLQFALGILGVLVLYIFWLLPERVTLEGIFGAYSVGNLILFEFLLGLLTCLAPATLLGVLFPVVVSLYTAERNDEIGERVGLLNALNTAGAVAGSLVTGFLLIPWLGLQYSTVGLSALNLALGGAVYWLAHRKRAVPAGVVALFVVLVLLLPPGYYLGFRADAPDTLRFYGEGVETTVAVFEVPEQNFKVSFVNGRIEVPTDPVSMRAFRLLGHLPALLKPAAQKALMLSFGNGISTGSLDTHGIPYIDAVDLSAEQFAAAAIYWQENYNVLRSAHLHTHIEDGRNFLLQTPHIYDIITTDATHPVNTSSWALFTEEFYRAVDARLAPDGVFMQWLPFHNLREEDFKRILRTFQHVFPHATLWYTGGSHTLVLATREPLTAETLRNAFGPAITNQIVIDDLGPPPTWPSYLALDAATLRTYTGGGPLTTDNDAFFLPYDDDNLRIMQTMEAAVRRQPAN
jgi:spermidine synthase